MTTVQAEKRSTLTEAVLSVIGSFVAEARIDPAPDTLNVVRDALVDCLGCIVVGATEGVAIKARAAMAHRTGNTAVFGTRETRAPEAAAFVNAVAGHAIDFDDWEIPGNTHPSIAIVPALLAAADGRTVTGRAFAEAYITGFEIIARLGEGLNFEHYDAGWHSTATFGPLGASAAVARLWGLTAEQATHAVGIAVSRASGLTAQFGSDTKPLQAGFAAEAGLTAATLAGAGLTAQPSALEGRSGYTALTAHGDDARLTTAFASMGAPLALQTHGLVFKPYPCCGYTHRVIDAALALRDRGVDPATIKSVKIALPDFHAAVLPFHTPTNAGEARFSLPFCAALALTQGCAAVADFCETVWTSLPITTLMANTTVVPFAPDRPHLNYDPEQPDRVTVALRDGRLETACVAYPLGAPQVPMTSDAILRKFSGIVARPLSDTDVRALSEWLDTPDLLSALKPWT